MIIRNMTARFGTLKGEKLELHEGLNIITAPNESGKSTWCAFLRAMLYGVDSAQRAKAGVLPDKKRYAPWDGGNMSGEMELCWQGKDITIARSGKASAPMREFTAEYTGTGVPVPELSGVTAGETLTGVSRQVFESSAFIGQSALRVTQGPELEKRIAAIVSTGEEDLSYTETDEQLRAWQRRRRWRTSGELPEVEREMETVTAALDELRDAEEETAALEAQVQRLELRCELLRKEVTESRKRARKESLARSAETREQLHQAQKTAAETRAEEKHLAQELESGTFGLTSPARVRADLEETANRTHALALAAQQRPAATAALVLLILGAVFLLAGLGLSFVIAAYISLPIAAVGVVLLAVGVVLLRKRKAQLASADAAAQERLEILSDFGVSDEDALLALAVAHEKRYIRWQGADAQAVHAEAALARAEELQQATEAEVLSALDFTGGSGEAAQLSRQLVSAEEELQRAREELAAAGGRAKVMGDPMSLRSELMQLQERHGELQSQYDALTLAIDTLRDADTEMRTRFSPRLSARATELFSFLTDGKYDRLQLDRALDAQVRKEGEATGHEALFLSGGAYDQLYLALRLAICELALPEGEKCPLILDDALGNFDDARCKRTLELLRELAKERQILLFSCHSREAALMADVPDVHITEL